MAFFFRFTDWHRECTQYSHVRLVLPTIDLYKLFANNLLISKDAGMENEGGQHYHQQRKDIHLGWEKNNIYKLEAPIGGCSTIIITFPYYALIVCIYRHMYMYIQFLHFTVPVDRWGAFFFCLFHHHGISHSSCRRGRFFETRTIL